MRGWLGGCALVAAAGCVDIGDNGAPGGGPDDDVPVPGDGFAMRVVATALAEPVELTWGPDDRLWITERVGRRITRVDPTDLAKTAVLTIPDAVQTGADDGVLGLALDPELLRGTGHDHLYVAYTYDADPTDGIGRATKLRRYTFDPTTESLVDGVDLLIGLPAGDQHNGGRLVLGPDRRLYLSIGDLGGNERARKCTPIASQRLPTRGEVDERYWGAYAGKVLRLELDGSIPADNPVLAGVRSHVFTYGHRDLQGLAFGRDGTLYAADRGPKTDDELEVLVAGRNYGWPHVAGYRDDRAYAYGDWSAAADCAELTYDAYTLPASVPVQAETAWTHPDFTPPIQTFGTVDDDYRFRDPTCVDFETMCWPTTAPGSLDVYGFGHEGIPGWDHALLVPSLKDGALYRVALTDDGQQAAAAPVRMFDTINRYRDVAIAPDGLTIYVLTDSEGITRKECPAGTARLEHPGSVLAFTYTRPRG